MIQYDVNQEIQSTNKKNIESKKILFNPYIENLSNASTFCSLTTKESDESKLNNISSNINTNSNIMTSDTKTSIIKNTTKEKSDNYSQNYDIMTQMKKQPPKLPELLNHDYNLNNVNQNSKNEAYGEIYKGKIPNIFYGHLMIDKNGTINKSCITQRNKKKLLTIIYYSP